MADLAGMFAKAIAEAEPRIMAELDGLAPCKKTHPGLPQGEHNWERPGTADSNVNVVRMEVRCCCGAIKRG